MEYEAREGWESLPDFDAGLVSVEKTGGGVDGW